MDFGQQIFEIKEARKKEFVSEVSFILIKLQKLFEALEENENRINFMLKRVNNVVTDVVREKLEEEGLKEFAIDVMKKYTKRNFEKVIKDIYEVTIKVSTKKLDSEYKAARDLCLSIDNEIKKQIRDLDCSYSTDKVIKTELTKIIKEVGENVSNKIIGKEEIKLIQTR